MVNAAFKIETLRALDLFSPLSDEELELMRPAVRVRVFSIGDVIIQEDDPANELFVLLVGEVKVVRDHRLPGEVIVGTLAPLQVFGELSLLGGGRRTATCVATDHCRLLCIDQSALEAVLMAHPATCLALLRDTYERVRILSDELATLKQGV